MKLQFTQEARAELDGAATYYRLRSPTAAIDFRREIKAILARITASPQQFPMLEREIRRAVSRNFPYNIFFEQHDDTILVTGIIHASREPFIWRNR